MTQALEAGKTGEQVAANFLQNNGYKILEMNYKNSLGKRLGEIDIIAEDKEAGELVFVEVKTRRLQGNEDTLPEENITRSNCANFPALPALILIKRTGRIKITALTLFPSGWTGSPERLRLST